MTTYAFPAIVPNTSSWELVSNTKVFRSALTGAIQTIDRGGEHWQLTMQFLNLRGDNKSELRAFLAKLNGQEHRFAVHDHSHIQRGNFGGTPLAASGGQTGTSLIVDGVTNTVDWIKAGDQFEVNGELKMATADSNSTGGLVTLNFRPRIWNPPADNAPINVVNPTGRFLLSDQVVGWANRPGDLTNFTVVGTEDIIG